MLNGVFSVAPFVPAWIVRRGIVKHTLNSGKVLFYNVGQ